MCGERDARGANMRTIVKVTYRSGRVEHHRYGTENAAKDAVFKFAKLPTVKRATVLKKKEHPTPDEMEKAWNR